MCIKTIHISVCCAVSGMLLTACGSTPIKPKLPDGLHRVAVNRAQAEQPQTPQNATPRTVETKEKPSLDVKTTQIPVDTFTWNPPASLGKPEPVLALSTLRKIAHSTSLTLRENGVEEELVLIIPNSDPFNVIGQIAEHASFGLTLDRPEGLLSLTANSPGAGLRVIRDKQPLRFIGEPVSLPKLPDSPISLSDALLLLAPPGFEVGFGTHIDRHIKVNISGIQGWEAGLASIAQQTPYKIICDWPQKLISVEALNRRTVGIKMRSEVRKEQ